VATALEPDDHMSIRRVAFSDVAADEWDRLAEASGTLFGTREFLTTWWEHYGEGGDLWLTSCRDSSGRLVALLPIYCAKRTGMRIARFLGHGPGDQLGPIFAPADRNAAGNAVRETLRGLACDVFLAEHLPAKDGWTKAFGERVVREEGSPLIEAESWEAYLASRTGHLRRQLGWQERRLAREGEVTYRLTDASTLEQDLDHLFALHEARWAMRTEFVADAAFHRAFAQSAFERGWLRLWHLELDGKPIASLHSFRFADREWNFQVGRDPAVSIVSPGLLLLWHSLHVAFDDGLTEYLLLRGDEDYKYRFATGDARLETIALGVSRLGKSAVRAGSVVDRLGPIGAMMREGLRGT
jgi:CelD/BcsL family acetyltransferase involved in cellulose biosynthesis